MANNLTSTLARLGLTPLMWFLQLLIMVTEKYLDHLISLFFYLEHVLDNLNQFKIPLQNIKTTANSTLQALKCLEIILQYHRKKHLKIRNKIKFHPTLPTIVEENETDQTHCNSPYLSPSNQPPDKIPTPAPTTNTSALPTPIAIQPINLDPNFSNYSFLIPDFIVPSDSTPSNFNNNFAAQFNLYIQQKNNRKPFKFIKHKFSTSCLKKVFTQDHHTSSVKKRLEEENEPLPIVASVVKITPAQWAEATKTLETQKFTSGKLQCLQNILDTFGTTWTNIRQLGSSCVHLKLPWA
ncbi:hypothetical protein TNCV_3073781 [Trichonephila clavipes]|nr:hypothetical protein TNCV_3073781 [Trichonephila clavipes]